MATCQAQAEMPLAAESRGRELRPLHSLPQVRPCTAGAGAAAPTRLGHEVCGGALGLHITARLVHRLQDYLQHPHSTGKPQWRAAWQPEAPAAARAGGAATVRQCPGPCSRCSAPPRQHARLGTGRRCLLRHLQQLLVGHFAERLHCHRSPRGGSGAAAGCAANRAPACKRAARRCCCLHGRCPPRALQERRCSARNPAGWRTSRCDGCAARCTGRGVHDDAIPSAAVTPHLGGGSARYAAAASC